MIIDETPKASVTNTPSMFVFNTAEAGDKYAGLESVPARLIFPFPFTLGHYKKYEDALNLRDLGGADIEAIENSYLDRQYRATLAVAQIEEGEWGDVPGGDDRFGLQNIDPDDPRTPLAWISWVTDCADNYIMSKRKLETQQAVWARRAASRNTSAVFKTHTPEYLQLFPDLGEYAGYVKFRAPFTRSDYKRWTNAMKLLPKYDPRDVQNSLFVRAFRGAVELIDYFDVPGISPVDLRQNDGNNVPLVLASWLVEVVDEYLCKRMNLKKMPSR